MKIGRRMTAVFLAVLMLALSMPAAFAQNEPQVADRTGYDVGGTNSVGRMVADLLDADAADQDENYYISDLTVSEGTATVTYRAQTDALIVVAAYDEDTMRMLCSGTADAPAQEVSTSVELTDLTAENMVIKAFMLDENHNALCKHYTFNGFTKAYKAFLAKDIYDFDAERVVNLDEAPDNNFLVLNQASVRATGNGTANTLVSADYESGVYAFENATQEITGLQSGDLFYYDDGDMENMVVVRVTAVTADANGDATVQGEAVALEDAFQHVRIDTTADGEDFELVESTVGEGVTFLDEENGGPNKAPAKAGDINDKTTLTKEFKLEKKHTNGYDPGGDEGTAGFYLTGSGKFTLEAKIKVYISDDVKEVFFALDPELSLNFTVEAKAEWINFELGTFVVRPIPGAYVSLTPTIVFKPSVKVSTSVKVKTTVGFGFDLENGFVNKCEKPSITFDGIKIEGTVFIGLDLKPHAHIITDKLAEVDMSGQLGFEVKASTDWFEKTWFKEEEAHLCTNCIGGDVKLKFNLGVDLTFLEGTKLESKFHHDFLNITFDLCQFYWSITFGDHGLGKCPHTQSSASSGAADGIGSDDDLSNGGTQFGVIRFGAYPQTRETDSETISALNSRAIGWQSYRYYSGTGSDGDGQKPDGQMTAKDYMQYCDVKYGGNKYRGVKFDTYRPQSTRYTSSTSNTHQDDNGYTTGTIYWFKYEPLQWKVLDPSEGLVLCVSLIDSQPYNNYILSSGTDPHGYTAYWGDAGKNHYANDYENSSLRKWLNETFYATAFTESQQNRIAKDHTHQNNDGYHTLTGSSNYTDYDSNPTNDKIFLLSYDEVLNSSYGFATSSRTYDTARQAKGTDYAKCQGLYVNSGGSYDDNSYWWLRSPGNASINACQVSYHGHVGSFYTVSGTAGGVRPACVISNLSSGNAKSGSPNRKAAPAAKAAATGAPETTVSGTTASRSNVVAGAEYVLLVVKDAEAENLLSPDNLLYIDQKTAESATASFDFTPREACEDFTAAIYGPVPHTPGDVNGDGVPNSKDLTRLMKYLAGEDVEVVEAALDLNGDGVVNNKDLTRLMKYLAGEDVQIF